MRGRVEQANGAEHAVAGLNQVVAVEARQLAQARQQGGLGLLDELARAGLVDRFIASNGGMHIDAPISVSSDWDGSVGSSRSARP